MLASHDVSPKRVRRLPAAARAEILAAAEAALEDLPFHALTVELLMERTGMTRSSFYHYFKSLDEVTIALFEQVENEVSGAVDDWLDHPDDSELAETAESHLTRMFEVWSQHSTLMHAMEAAAGRNGEGYERWRERIVDRYVVQTTRFIERQVELGRSDVTDSATLASALILMNLAVASDRADRREPASPSQLGATIGRIWNAAIFSKQS